MIGVTALAIVAFVIGACEVKVHHNNAAFSEVAVGDSESAVVTRFGEPTVRETATQPFFVMPHRRAPNFAQFDCGGK